MNRIKKIKKIEKQIKLDKIIKNPDLNIQKNKTFFLTKVQLNCLLYLNKHFYIFINSINNINKFNI